MFSWCVSYRHLYFHISVFFPEITDLFPELLAFKFASKESMDFFTTTTKQIFADRKNEKTVRLVFASTSIVYLNQSQTFFKIHLGETNWHNKNKVKHVFTEIVLKENIVWTCIVFFFLFFSFCVRLCRFYVVIRLFPPHHNVQWPPTSNVDYSFIFFSFRPTQIYCS